MKETLSFQNSQNCGHKVDKTDSGDAVKELCAYADGPWASNQPETRVVETEIQFLGFTCMLRSLRSQGGRRLGLGLDAEVRTGHKEVSVNVPGCSDYVLLGNKATQADGLNY